MVFDFVQFQAITQVSQLLLIALLTIKNINFSVCFANYVTINLNKPIKSSTTFAVSWTYSQSLEF